MKSAKHIIIVGGGIAGTLLAVRLCMLRQRVTLIDARAPESASQVAAGLFNVITGRFGAKSWMADTLLPELLRFMDLPAFSALKSFIHFQEIYRPFKEPGEYNKWLSRAEDPAFSKWVRFESSPLCPEQVHNPLGGIVIEPCGWIEIPKWIRGLQDWCEKTHGLRRISAQLSHSQINISSRSIKLQDEKLAFDELVFCEGYQAAENPFFPNLPLIPNKGEVLLVESDAPQLPFVLSRGAYLIPLGGKQYLAGSTYRNEFESPAPTEAARQQIEEKLALAWKDSWQVVGHRAGIRPTTPDRKPILGQHPEWDHMHLFTGFGTKGVLLAPHFSTIMAQRLLYPSTEIPAIVELSRFSDSSARV